MKKFAFLRLIAIICACSLGGCVHYGQFRDDARKKSAHRQPSPMPARELCDNDPDVDLSHKSIWCPNGDRKYYLAFIEVDEFGEMFNRQQLKNALDLIQCAKANSKTKFQEKEDGPIISTRNAIVVTFIHGWKNNASDSSGNVWGFRDALKDLTDAVTSEMSKRHKVPGEEPEPVVGIYIGWRGAVTNLGVVKEFTFFNRRDAATRIPGADLTEILSEIAHQTKARVSSTGQDECPNPNPAGTQAPESEANGTAEKIPDPGTDSLSIVVGHSFGGLVLERTLTQAVTAQLLREEADRRDRQARHEEKSGGNLVKPVTDLIVMVNEAAPATEGKQLLDLLRNHQFHLCVGGKMNSAGNRCIENQPLFLSITSTGDWATGLTLPIGQGATSLVRRNFRTYYDPKCTDPEHKGPNCQKADPKEVPIPGQRTYYLHSAAHLPPLFSHVLLPADDPNIQQWVDAANEAVAKDKNVQDWVMEHPPVQGENVPPSQPECKEADEACRKLDIQNPDVHCFCSKVLRKAYVITPLSKVYNDTPYWIMQMGREFVPDHSQIFRPAFRELLQQFILQRLDINRPGAPAKRTYVNIP